MFRAIPAEVREAAWVSGLAPTETLLRIAGVERHIGTSRPEHAEESQADDRQARRARS